MKKFQFLLKSSGSSFYNKSICKDFNFFKIRLMKTIFHSFILKLYLPSRMTFFLKKNPKYFVFSIILLIVFLDIDESLLAVSLTYVLMISGSFQWCIRQSAEVDNLVSTKSQLNLLVQSQQYKHQKKV